MTRNLNSHQDGAVRGEYPLLEEFENLWQEASELCEKHRHTPAFEGYVSGDYAALYHALAELQGQAWTFLEWGSGLAGASSGKQNSAIPLGVKQARCVHLSSEKHLALRRELTATRQQRAGGGSGIAWGGFGAPRRFLKRIRFQWNSG